MPTEITPEQREALVKIIRSAALGGMLAVDGQARGLTTVDEAMAGVETMVAEMVGHFLALGWRAPGPATEEEVESAARAMAANDLWHRWQGYASMARAALNATLNKEAGNG